MCGAFMDGGGIVINAFNRGWAPLSRLCDKLQAIFYAAVMNLYLKPASIGGGSGVQPEVEALCQFHNLLIQHTSL